jgi:hypothetical protein
MFRQVLRNEMVVIVRAEPLIILGGCPTLTGRIKVGKDNRRGMVAGIS